jgi:hypothetical protein
MRKQRRGQLTTLLEAGKQGRGNGAVAVKDRVAVEGGGLLDYGTADWRRNRQTRECLEKVK